MPSDPQLMQCMEVWGGNQPVENFVAMPGLDAWVYSRPYRQADGGGDVYYVSSCATGRITRLLVADVSGHGSAVCDIAGQLRALMRAHVNRLDQVGFVRAMNRQFTALSQDGCFATAVVTTFFAPTNRLTLCNAGHPAPLLYRGRSREWTLMERPDSEDAEVEDGVYNLPLGIEHMTNYQQLAAELEVGDLVLCYSDSLIESKNATGAMLGQRGLLEAVKSISVDDPGRVISLLMETISSMAPNNLIGDDVTALMFRPNGVGMRVPWSTRLSAPFRVLAAVSRSVRGRESMPLPDLNLANLGGAIFGPLNRLWSLRKPSSSRTFRSG